MITSIAFVNKPLYWLNKKFESICKIGTNYHDLNDHQRRMIGIVNLVSSLTVLLNFLPGTLLFFLTREYLIFFPSCFEGLLFMLVPFLNSRRKYNAAVFVMFSAHCASALYFGLLFGPAVNLYFITIFLIGSVYLLFQSKVYRRLSIICTVVMLVVLELDYTYGFVPPLLLSGYNIEVVKKLATGIVLVLDGLVGYFYISALLKQNERQEKLVEERTAQLKLAADAMEAFTRNVSHEMRIHLNKLALTNQELCEMMREQNNRKFLLVPCNLFRKFDTATKELQTLVNTVLDFSKIKEGKIIDLTLKPIVVKDWANERVDYYSDSADAKHVEISLNIEANVPPRLVTSAWGLNRIFDNLMSNALKWAPKNSKILVRIYIDPETAALKLDVTDEGPGIAANQQESIFELFTTKTNGFADGTGVGLPTARNIAETLGGSLTLLKEQEGFGTTFILTHPILQLKKENTIAPIDSKRENFKEAKVLVVDDDEQSYGLFKMSLERLGCIPTLAATGKSALPIAIELLPDIILLDKKLPDISGMDVLKELRSNKLTKNIPVIIVSGDPYKDDEEEALKAGANGYLIKPAMIDSVNAQLKKFLSFRVIAS